MAKVNSLVNLESFNRVTSIGGGLIGYNYSPH